MRVVSTLECDQHSFLQLSPLRPAMVRLCPLLRPPGSTPAEAGCVPRGQRALLDADMLELIDRSACLVEPFSVEPCAPPPVLVLFSAASTSSAASGRCSRMSFPRGLVEGLLLPESSLRAAPVASLRLLLLDDRDLSRVLVRLERPSVCSSYAMQYQVRGCTFPAVA